MSRTTTSRRLGSSPPPASSASWPRAARATPPRPTTTGSQAPAGASSDNDAPGEKVTIGFSGPAADHGWLAAINNSAKAEAAKYTDIEFKQAEGTNDASLQISQIETFINDKVDAIVLLPTDGAALTEVATKAMNAGIIVVNVDREFSTPVRRPHHGAR